MIEVKIDNKHVIEALERLAKGAANPRPALLKIGERLVVSTKKRFETSTAPDGTKWAPNSQVTMLGRLTDSKGGRLKSLHRKDGRVNSKGSTKIMSKRPLIGITHALFNTINSDLTGNDLIIGSPMVYAATQQFGAKQGAFGRTKRNVPVPWGNIPARPFLGVSDEDEHMIIETISEYLRSVIV